MLNKYLYIIICAILGLVFHIQGFAQSYTPSWNELRQGLIDGKEESFNYLVRLKSHLENIEEWDETTKGTYQSAIRLLSDYASKQSFYDFQEGLLLDALNSYQKRDSTNNRYRRDMLVSMTVLYNNKKDYDRVIKYGIEAIELYQNAEDYGLEYITLMHNLSTGALAVNDCESANRFALEGLRSLSALDMQNSVSYNRLQCYLWNICGRIAFRQSNFSLAEEYYSKCISNALKYGFTSVLRLARNNLAVLYIKQNEYNKAHVILDAVNKEHPSCESLLNLLHLQYRLNDSDSLINENLTQYNNLRYLQSTHVINSSGEIERTMFLDAITKEMIWNNNLIAAKFSNTTKETFDTNLFGRNISIGVNVALRNISRGQDLYNIELTKLRRQLLSKNLSYEQRDSLYEQVTKLETYLLSTSNTALNDEIECVGSWDVIKDSLREEDVVLLFCYIPKIVNENQTCDYGVYIGTREMDSPTLVPLCNADEIEDLVLPLSNNPISVSEFYLNNSGQIANLIWDKILIFLKGKNRIYYTPTGVLSLINLEAIKLKNGNELGDCYEMIVCSSPAIIKDIRNKTLNLSAISFFGAPNFNLGTEGMEELSEKHTVYSGQDIHENLNIIDAIYRSGWGELPGTVYEISTLSSLTSVTGIKTLSYIGNEATEEQFKELSGRSPDIIHIATHGFSYSQTNENENSDFGFRGIDGTYEVYSIMQLSGLVLTGGNNVWQGKNIPVGVEDGILTADEIARLDLSDTDLVVLSACDTGLGIVDPVDGVWGLQRAFKQAGVGSILMTLWKIPDNTTTMFMTEFYKQLLSGKTKHQSLKAAQKYMKENGASDPYYWASFILLDAN